MIFLNFIGGVNKTLDYFPKHTTSTLTSSEEESNKLDLIRLTTCILKSKTNCKNHIL